METTEYTPPSAARQGFDMQLWHTTYDSKEVIDEPELTGCDTEKRNNAREQLEQIRTSSVWFIARQLATVALGDSTKAEFLPALETWLRGLRQSELNESTREDLEYAYTLQVSQETRNAIAGLLGFSRLKVWKDNHPICAALTGVSMFVK